MLGKINEIKDVLYFVEHVKWDRTYVLNLMLNDMIVAMEKFIYFNEMNNWTEEKIDSLFK